MSTRDDLIEAALVAITEHAAEWAEVKGYSQVQLAEDVRCSLREIVAIVVDTLAATGAVDDEVH